MKEAETTSTRKRKTGPGRIDRSDMSSHVDRVKGIENVYTINQYKRLLEYLDIREEDRPPFMRLGSSVPTKKKGEDPEKGEKKVPKSTWVVTVRGEVEVIVREQDPRRAQRWMECDNRPWNMYRFTQPLREVALDAL